MKFIKLDSLILLFICFLGECSLAANIDDRDINAESMTANPLIKHGKKRTRNENFDEEEPTEATKKIRQMEDASDFKILLTDDEKLKDLSLKNPGFGRKKLSKELLRLHNVSLSENAIRNRLKNWGMDTKDKRLQQGRIKFQDNEEVLATIEKKALEKSRKHPQSTVDRIIDLANGSIGTSSTKIKKALKAEGLKVSITAILSILEEAGFEKKPRAPTIKLDEDDQEVLFEHFDENPFHPATEIAPVFEIAPAVIRRERNKHKKMHTGNVELKKTRMPKIPEELKQRIRDLRAGGTTVNNIHQMLEAEGIVLNIQTIYKIKPIVESQSGTN